MDGRHVWCAAKVRFPASRVPLTTAHPTDMQMQGANCRWRAQDVRCSRLLGCGAVDGVSRRRSAANFRLYAL